MFFFLSQEFVRQEDGKENEILINGNKIESLRKKWLQKSSISKLDFASIVGLPFAFLLLQIIMLLSHQYVL